jgi:hypothetical protein
VGAAEQRIVENNNLFREANERIRATSDGYDHPVEPIPFLCECAKEDCTTIVRLTAKEYADIRGNGQRYFTAPGHERHDEPVGLVVSRRESYIVVEKRQ